MDTRLGSYGRGTRVLLFIARFVGSLFISIALVTFFIMLFIGSLSASVGKVHDIAPIVAAQFFEEHRAEVRSLFIEKAGIPEPKTLEEKRKIDALVYDQLMEGFLSKTGSRSVEIQIKSVLSGFIDRKSMVYGISGFLFAVGIFLIFVSYMFKPFISTYKAASSVAVDSFIITFAFFLLRRLTPESVSEIFSSVGGVLFGAEAASAPSVIIKLSASVLIEWVRLAAKGVLIASVITFGVFLVIVVSLRIFNYFKHASPPEKLDKNLQVK